MEWVASTLHTTSEHGASSITTTDDPADLNGIVHFAERRNLVSVRVPSHFKHSLHISHPSVPWPAPLICF